jgi:predicted secreted protein
MKKITNRIQIFLWLVGIAAGANYLNAQTPMKVGPEAIWTPAANEIDTIHKQCDSSSDFSSCFISYLQKSGASPQAIQFIQMNGQMGYMSQFKKVGPVDIAYVTFPFRANENLGCYLALPQAELNQNSTYQQLAKQYPNISIWPGDRTGTNYPAVEDLQSGGKQFVVNYIFRDMCHACAIIGSGSFAFQFDSTGKLLGIHLVSAEPKGTTGQQFSDPTQPVQVNSGQQFTIVLDSNRTTGYQWQLAHPVDEKILKQVSNSYEAPSNAMPGAGGKEFWIFQAVGKGKTTIDFEYVRPWEKTTPRATSTSFQVEVN